VRSPVATFARGRQMEIFGQPRVSAVKVHSRWQELYMLEGFIPCDT
jgi:hypothetical protein